MIIPNDVKCGFCTKIFCCSKCRQKHEDKVHVVSFHQKQEEDELKKHCQICNGQKFPLLLEVITSNSIFDHILKDHLPLKCHKCTKIFHNKSDFENIEKCCTITIQKDLNIISKLETKENDPKMLETKENDPKMLPKIVEHIDDAALTPLTKINMRWRRKSKGYDASVEADSGTSINVTVPPIKMLEIPQSPPTNLVRKTSTPMHFTNTNNFSDPSYNASSIQYSSHCTSSSSDSDAYSPPLPAINKPTAHPSPKSVKKEQIQNRSQRQKMSVQATPLRQVMTKSIQRAIAQHGIFKQFPYPGLQQRKMMFDSTGSSGGESINNTSSLPSALDLRTSPVIRRTKSDSKTPKQHQTFVHENSENILHGTPSRTNRSSRVGFDNFEVIIQKSITEIVSLYQSDCTEFYSCHTNVADESSISGVEILDYTPRITGNNMIKKTISFDTPTSGYLSPILIQPLDTKEDDEDDNEVFSTPGSTPVKSFSCPDYTKNPRSVNKVLKEAQEISHSYKKPVDQKASNLWSLVSSVINRTSKKKDNKDSSENKAWAFKFNKSSLVKHAASFAGMIRKTMPQDEHDDYEYDQPQMKRRRTSSNKELTQAISPPQRKKQKIHGRKPIERMRKES
ncbi:unnamed protein product [Diamesa tonsa]